jgi:MraZ protein
MLLGQHDGKIDEKSRTAFPKRFREVLGDKLIITQGFEKSLIVVSEDGWRALLEGTEGKPFTTNIARDTQRFLLGRATFTELDEKGRFILPDYLKLHANITNEVVFLGLSRYVEIWDKKIWEEYHTELSKNIETITEKLTEGV